MLHTQQLHFCRAWMVCQGWGGAGMQLDKLQLPLCVLRQYIVLTLAKSTGASALIMRTSSSDFMICRPMTQHPQFMDAARSQLRSDRASFVCTAATQSLNRPFARDTAPMQLLPPWSVSTPRTGIRIRLWAVYILTPAAYHQNPSKAHLLDPGQRQLLALVL